MIKRKGKKLLLVDLEEGLLDLYIVKELLKKGVKVFLAQEKLPAYLKKILPAYSFIQTDPYNSRNLLTNVMTYINKHGIWFDGVGTYSEHAVPNTAILTQMLGLKGINPGIAYRSSNFKLSMREFCFVKGIDMPQYIFLETLSEKLLSKAIKLLNGPVVVKPVLGYSSIGVYKINKNENLTSVIHKINAACKVNRDGVLKNFNYTFLVESYVEGVQISVDGIVNNNKILFAGIVETVVSPPPNFTAYANYFPPRISKLAQNKAFRYCIKVIKALDFNNCAFHCELKLTKQGPVLIEIACRPPGGSIMEGYKKAYGIDFFTAMLDLWLGNNISLACKHSVYLHQAGVFYEKKGILKSIEGIKKLKEKRNIHEIYRVSHIGHRLTNYPDIPAPIYYFSVEAPTAVALEKEIQAIKETVIFKII